VLSHRTSDMNIGLFHDNLHHPRHDRSAVRR
jgi:hypothetical protein